MPFYSTDQLYFLRLRNKNSIAFLEAAEKKLHGFPQWILDVLRAVSHSGDAFSNKNKCIQPLQKNLAINLSWPVGRSAHFSLHKISHTL